MSEQITLTELARLSGRSVPFLSRLVADGRLPAVGKSWKRRYVDKAVALKVLDGIQKRQRQDLTSIEDLL